MNEFERRARQMANPFSTRFTHWWCHSRIRTTWMKRTEGNGDLRQEASSRAQRAAARLNDLRESGRGKRAASALHDLRSSDAAKRAEAALHDLRTSDAGKRAESALADLRQREPVKKAEENARRVLHDLFSGGSTPAS